MWTSNTSDIIQATFVSAGFHNKLVPELWMDQVSAKATDFNTRTYTRTKSYLDCIKQAREIKQEPRTPMQIQMYTWSTVLLINTWRQAGLSRGFVDYSENGEHTDNI